MLFPRLALLAGLVASVAADWEILSPSSDVWWVAKSENTLTWTCNDPQAQANPEFTVLVGNTNPTVLTTPIAIIAIEQNYVCSQLITQDMLTAGPGDNYVVYFANTLNSSDYYVQSSPFSIEALGSAYPTATPGLSSSVSAVSGTVSATGSGAAASATGSASSKGNGAVSAGVAKAGVLLGAAAAVLGMVL
ncbi:hypothetical protein H0H92_001660 [Tricholoma furcatifolium]|nr:hypothetical protein H0H92_001660 [Tricholoma furcatifolium]